MVSSSKFYVYESRIDENCNKVKSAFSNIRFSPAYSVKTNSVPTIIKRFHKNGFYIEVVSDLEVQYAEMIGVPLKDIIYNGPLKGEKAIDVAKEGGIISFDSEDDYNNLKPPKGTRCMFRVAVDIDNHLDTRFGTRKDKIKPLIERAVKDGMNVVGIHCHATKGRSLKYWQNRINEMSEVYNHVKNMLTDKIVDFGGNMFSPMNEKQAKCFGEYASYTDYAKLFEDNIHKLEGATIAFEMGTSVVANCMDFITKVIGIKETGRNVYVLLDCCKYHLGWATDTHNFDIDIERNNENGIRISHGTFVGRLCVENDVIYNDFNGVLAIGDVIKFKEVGAYTIAVKPPFIINQLPIIYVNKYGCETLIKREETAKDIMSTYII